MKGPENPGLDDPVCDCLLLRLNARRDGIICRSRVLLLLRILIGFAERRVADGDLAVLLGLVQKLKILVAHDELTNLVLDLLERRRRSIALVLDLDDVPAEIGLDRRLGVGADRQGECRVFEFLDHAAMAKVAEIAAIGLVRIRGLFLGKRCEILAAVEFLDDCLGFVLGLHQDVAGMHFFLLRQGSNFLVVASLDFIILDGVGNMRLEIGVVQLAVTQIGHVRLEIRRLVELLGGGLLRQQLDIDRSGERGDLLLVVRKLAELRIEIGNRQIKFRLMDFDIADLGDDGILGIGRKSRRLEGNDRCESNRGKFVVFQHKITLRWSRPARQMGIRRKKPSAGECGLCVSAKSR
ncbi:hypothetical protein RHSP_63246 [Rhizobium freirei PRF 81]|uniref:NAD-specific glutamate dehydrogenase n=1 Tax=Rhizobium freirei PRF 81 TaxID=363754 RepID=N6V9D4_9HYPH|nr:hypothetical protein RHSP_63246 [Rhizobium freirei PRF 81]